MPKMIFVNLPVADVAKSTAFYEALGFTKNPQFSNEVASAMNWSDTITLMILGHDFYQTFIPHKTIADTSTTNAALICLSFDDRAGVNAITDAAARAGGKADVRPPQDMGFMYSRAFEDLDGHLFEPMHMDMEAAMAAFPDGAAHEPA
ncbi:VOC family protein [Sphingomonas sp. LT1P40]|uniref:VOC family protein n=1 Tax=Alteristakelama amylovorans TaxID=3096166 RepID=UPI002FC71B75